MTHTAIEVRVKPLEFEWAGEQCTVRYAASHAFWVGYRVGLRTDGRKALHVERIGGEDRLGDYASWDDAEAAAQADYEARILAALDRSPTVVEEEAFPRVDGKIAPPVEIGYTNYRGEFAVRCIVPLSFWYGATDWHPEPQWLVKAWDADKGAERDFAFKDFSPASPSTPEQAPSPVPQAVAWRDETEAEHIARDIKEGRFPARSEKQQRPAIADAWERMRDDAELDAARRKLSMHELRRIIKHAVEAHVELAAASPLSGGDTGKVEELHEAEALNSKYAWERDKAREERDAAEREINTLTHLVQTLIDNDPDEPIADSGETVLDLWRHNARAAIRTLEGKRT